MSRLPHMGTSIFTQMTQLAGQYGAINLAQGFPNFPIDGRLSEIIARKAFESVHQYQPASGHAGLLRQLANLTQTSYGRAVDPEREILVTAGATQGIFTAIQALAGPGDEIILLDPCYDCYQAPVLLTGATAVHVSMTPGYTPDWPAIDRAANDKTRLIVINTPHNPSGKMWQQDDFEALERLLDKHPKLLVLSDEVYEYICFGSPHLSVHSRATLHSRSICISSFGKSFHITGWKVGYVIACQALMSEIKKVHQYLVFSVNSLAQAALCEYLDVVDVKQLGEFYKQKRDAFRDMLSASRFELLPCDGTYFQLVSYANLSDKNDVDFARTLAVEFGVAAIPVSVFNADGKDLKHLRFCFAKDNETLMAAAARLEKL